MLWNMTDVERLEQNFHEHAKRKSECSLIRFVCLLTYVW